MSPPRFGSLTKNRRRKVRVPASAPLTWLGREASQRGWAGLTWAVGLPGNVGGATVNNAGAHGTEFKDALVDLRLVEDSGSLVERDQLVVTGVPHDPLESAGESKSTKLSLT